MDPLTKSYPELTPYQFASNTPIWAIDLDGLEAYFIHGTGQSSNWWRTSSTSKTRKFISSLFGNTKQSLFNWSPGPNSVEGRVQAGLDLADHIQNTRVRGEPITIVGHSHGGNVGALASQVLINKYDVSPTDINLLLFNTPRRSDRNDGELAITNLASNEVTKPSYLFVPPSSINTYSIISRRDLVKFVGEQTLSKYDWSWFTDYNFDQEIRYDDQYPFNAGGGVGIGNHLGPTDVNLSEWSSPLKRAYQEISTRNKQRASYHNAPDPPIEQIERDNTRVEGLKY